MYSMCVNKNVSWNDKCKWGHCQCYYKVQCFSYSHSIMAGLWLLSSPLMLPYKNDTTRSPQCGIAHALSLDIWIGGEKMLFYSPKHTVSSKRITVSCTVTWTAAVFVEAPVSHHAPVTVCSTYSRLTDAVSVGGVAEWAVSQVEGHRAQRVTAACWERKKGIRCEGCISKSLA